MKEAIYLDISETQTEPLIRFSNGTLEIKGKSIPTDSMIHYGKLIEVFYKYSHNPEKRTEIRIDLEYINSSSSRSLLNLLIIAEHIYKEGHEVSVTWFHDSSDPLMYEQANVFKELLSLPFKIVAK